MKKLTEFAAISGGHIIAYPIVGCVGYTALTYANNPDSTRYELAKGCGKGAIHSLNPAFGLAGRVSTSPIGKYAFSMAYSGAGHMGVERIAPSDKRYVCSAEHFIGGFDE